MTTTVEAGPLAGEQVQTIDAYWRAANYLSVGQIYLMANPLLTEPLRPEHIKPRLLGHWGTSPGPELHLGAPQPRHPVHDQPMMTSSGPAMAGPAALANTWLEGSYSEVYPSVPAERGGHAEAVPPVLLPRRGAQPRGAGDPGSINEGGELGYSLSHAYGAAFDNPGLIVACVVGDGEAETGPLATSWHGHRFLDPARDGAVLPILHLNGWKIANPTVLARIPDRPNSTRYCAGTATSRVYVTGHEPAVMHPEMAAAVDDGI